MRQALHYCFLVSCLIGLAACGSFGQRRLPPAPLLPPAALGLSAQLTQRVTVDSGEERQTFLAAWAVQTSGLVLAGLSPAGQRLLTLSWDGQQFAEEYSPVLEGGLPGRDVLSQLQLAHWPLTALEESLANSPWRVEARQSGALGERQLYFGNTLILTISTRFAPGGEGSLPAAVSITSHVSPLRLEVETLQVEVSESVQPVTPPPARADTQGRPKEQSEVKTPL